MRFVWWVSAVLLSGAVARAGEPLSLERALSLARAHSPALGARAEEAEAADWRVKQSWARLLPRVSTTARYSRVNLVDPPTLEVPVRLPNQPPPTITLGEGIDEMMGFGVVVEQPLFTGGALWAQRRAADAAARLATERERAEAQDLELRTREAFVGVLRARQLAAVAERSESVLREHQARVERLVSAGAATPLDVSRVRTGVAAARVRRLTAEAGRAGAELALATLLGLEPGDLGALDDGEPASTPEADSVEARPEVRAAKAAVELQQAQATAASAPLYPHLAVRFAAQYDNPSQRYFPWHREFNLTWDASLVATWALWEWGAGWFGRQAALAEARAARRQADAAVEGATLDLARRRLEVSTGPARIAAAEEAVASAEAALSRAQRLCEAGQATCLGVLDAESDWARAQAEVVTARLDHRLAQAALARAAGALSTEGAP